LCNPQIQIEPQEARQTVDTKFAAENFQSVPFKLFIGILEPPFDMRISIDLINERLAGDPLNRSLTFEAAFDCLSDDLNSKHQDRLLWPRSSIIRNRAHRYRP